MKFLIVLINLGIACANIISPGPAQILTTGLDTTLGVQPVLNAIGPIQDNNNRVRQTNQFANLRGNTRTNNEGAVTNEANFDRQCGVADLECIRRVLQQNSRCRRTVGPQPRRVLQQNTQILASVNLTVTFGNLEIIGLNTVTVTEFFINRVTRNLVIAFRITNLSLTSNNTFFAYHRNAREPIVLQGQSALSFASLNITMIIPRVNDLRLELAEVYSYVNAPANSTVFTFSPSLTASQNPAVLRIAPSIPLSTRIIGREVLVLLAPLISADYLQNNFCDFRVRIFSA